MIWIRAALIALLFQPAPTTYWLQSAPFLNHPIYWPVSYPTPEGTIELTPEEYAYIENGFVQFGKVQEFIRAKAQFGN